MAWIVSGSQGLRVFGQPDEKREKQVSLPDAGPLCAAAGQIYCACRKDDLIWRLDGKTFAPSALFAGGPGVCQLLEDGGKLFALCADADSLLMLDASSGAPLIINRAGVCPRSMALDAKNGVLAVAGGGCGETLLLSVSTLEVIRRLPMPGMAFAAALQNGTVYSLVLTDTLDALLVTVPPSGVRQTLPLEGMPGLLLCRPHALLCACTGCLYIVSLDGTRILAERRVPGRPGRALISGGELLLLDPLSESVYDLNLAGGHWRLFCRDAQDMIEG